MAKNIVICSDGTGNTAIKGRGTNVFKLFEAVDLNGHRTNAHLVPQIAFYDDGVGTENFKPLRLLTGAAGAGLGRNVRQLYSQLSRVYDEGDRIFLFGFSRGAFTVRTLAGMINTCGLVDGTRIETSQKLRRAVRDAYCAYRAGYDSVITKAFRTLARRPGRKSAVEALRASYRVHHPVPIAFMGVWDTVDAVGLPFGLSDFVNTFIYQFKFPTQNLSRCVDYACQALSIDEPRVAFKPVLWDETPDDTCPEREAPADAASKGPRLDQVWFAGVHSNVGGGYPKQGMSLVALEWMLYKARACSLRLNDEDLRLFSAHASVDDKLYDPRAGFGLFYRWSPRNIEALCCKNKVSPQIHVTVAERLAHGTDEYALGNLPRDSQVVITEIGDASADEVASLRAKNVQDVIRRAHQGRTDLLTKVKGAISIGEVSVLAVHRRMGHSRGGRHRRDSRVRPARSEGNRVRRLAPGGEPPHAATRRTVADASDDLGFRVADRRHGIARDVRLRVVAVTHCRQPHERRILELLAQATAGAAHGLESRA